MFEPRSGEFKNSRKANSMEQRIKGKAGSPFFGYFLWRSKESNKILFFDLIHRINHRTITITHHRHRFIRKLNFFWFAG